MSYCVVVNTPGYLPEADPFYCETREEAVEAAGEAVKALTEHYSTLQPVVHRERPDYWRVRYTLTDKLDTVVEIIEFPFELEAIQGLTKEI